MIRIKTYAEALRSGELLTFLEVRQYTFVEDLAWEHMWSGDGMEIDQYDNMRHASLLLVGKPTLFVCRLLHAKRSMVRTWLPETYKLLHEENSFELSRRVNFRSGSLRETRQCMSHLRPFFSSHGAGWYFAIADERVLKAYKATGVQPDTIDACPEQDGLFLAQWRAQC